MRINKKQMEMMYKVCNAFAIEMDRFDRTMKVYEFLRDSEEQNLRPKEIAIGMDYCWLLWNGRKEPRYQEVANSLYLLMDMGLVKREAHKYTITLNYASPKKVKVVKVIDGIEMVGYKETYSYEKETTYYTWSIVE